MESQPQSSQEQVPEQSVEQSEQPHILRPDSDYAVGGQEQIVAPDASKIRLRKGILRPHKIKAIAAAAVVGVASLGASGDAEAGGVKGLDQALKTIAIGMVNGTVLSNTPIGATIDNNGNIGVVAKTPDQMAVGRPVNFEPGVREYAASIGANVFDQNTNFTIINRNNPDDRVSINKFTDANNYTNNISLRREQGGGVLLSTTFVKNGVPRSQVAVIRMDQTGKFQVTVMGGN